MFPLPRAAIASGVSDVTLPFKRLPEVTADLAFAGFGDGVAQHPSRPHYMLKKSPPA